MVTLHVELTIKDIELDEVDEIAHALTVLINKADENGFELVDNAIEVENE